MTQPISEQHAEQLRFAARNLRRGDNLKDEWIVQRLVSLTRSGWPGGVDQPDPRKYRIADIKHVVTTALIDIPRTTTGRAVTVDGTHYGFTSEARWGAFFGAVGWRPHYYQPEALDKYAHKSMYGRDVLYTPDFRLFGPPPVQPGVPEDDDWYDTKFPNRRAVLVEVKGRATTVDHEDIREACRKIDKLRAPATALVVGAQPFDLVCDPYGRNFPQVLGLVRTPRDPWAPAHFFQCLECGQPSFGHSTAPVFTCLAGGCGAAAPNTPLRRGDLSVWPYWTRAVRVVQDNL